MEILSKAHSKMRKQMAMEFTPIVTDRNILVTGLMTCKMVMVKKYWLMEVATSENLRRE